MSAPPDPGSGFFVSGGTLKPSAPSYVERVADREFLEHLRAGEFCYVLTSRQMGKSSLMTRTAARLRKDGVRTAIVDLTVIGEGGDRGEPATAAAWYFGVAHAMEHELELSVDLKSWWSQRDGMPEQQRFTEFLENVVLGDPAQRVVILVDEIDSTLRLPFTDDFFAGIRACYNARASKPAFERLTFALLGVASPTDLIKDATRTPFNIGHRIELHDFSLAEAQTLAAGLRLPLPAAARALERILHWTAGQPYLTQRLCLELSRQLTPMPTPDDPAPVVDRLAEQLFLSPEGNRDEVHFKYVRDRVRMDRRARRVLQTYGRILRGGRVVARPQSLAHNALRLAGLVRQTADGLLECRNRIYEAIFSLAWVRQVMPANLWQRAAIGSVLVLVGLMVLWAAWLQPLQQTRNAVANLSTSIRGAEEDVPRLAYARLKRIPHQAELAEQLWADYWHRRALKLDGLAAQLASLQTTNTPRAFTDLEGSVVSLVEALEGAQVPQVADRQATRLLAAIESPKETSAVRVSSLGSALAALARRADPPAAAGLADRALAALANPRETSASRLAEFGVMLAAAAEPMPAPAIPALADRVAGLLEKPPDHHVARLSSLGAVLARLAARMEPDAASGVAARGAVVVCLAIESPGNTNVAELSSLADTLARLVIQMNTPNGSELAGRGAATVAAAIENREELDGTNLLKLDEAFAALATRADPRSAVALVERMVDALGSRDETDTDRLDSLRKAVLASSSQVGPPALGTAGERLIRHLDDPDESDADRLTELVRTLTGIADRADRDAAQRLAARGGTALMRVFEAPKEFDADDLSALASMLASLADRTEPAVRDALAARGAGALVRVMETPGEPDADDLATLGPALARLGDRAAPANGRQLATQGADVLAQAMEDLCDSAPADLPWLGEALAMLANRADPVRGAALAGRGALALARTMQSRAGTNTLDLSAGCDTLILLANRLTPEVATQVAGSLADEMGGLTGRGTPALLNLGSALAAVTARMEPQAAGDVAARGLAEAAKALKNPGENGADQLDQLVRVLNALAVRADATELGSTAGQVCQALENPAEMDRGRLFALASVLVSRAERLDSRTAASLAERLASSMERPEETVVLRLASMAQALAAMAGRVQTNAAQELGSRGAVILGGKLQDPGETNTVALSSLARALGNLAARMDARAAAAVAARGSLVLVARAAEEAHRTRESDLSELAAGLGALAHWLKPQDRAAVAERIADVLLDQENHDTEVWRLGEVLTTLADRLEPGDVAPLAEGFGAALARYEEVDPAHLSWLRSTLGELADRLEARDAARVAEKLVRALEHPQETDHARQANLGSALAATLPRMEPKAAERAASRAAPALSRAVERSTDESSASSLASALLALASRVEPEGAAQVARLFRRHFEDVLQTGPLPRLSLADADMFTLKKLMQPQDATRFISRLTSALKRRRETDTNMVLNLSFWFVDRMESEDAAFVTDHLAAHLTRTLERQVEGEPGEQAATALGLALVLSRMEPDEAAVLAGRVIAILVGALEDPNQTDEQELALLGLGLVPMIAHLPPDEASRVARLATLRCAQSLEETVMSANSEHQHVLVCAISLLTVWMEPAPAAALAARTAPLGCLVFERGDFDEVPAKPLFGLWLATLSARLAPDRASEHVTLAGRLFTKPAGIWQPNFHGAQRLVREALEGFDPILPLLGPRVTGPLFRDWLHAVETLKARAPEAGEELEKIAALFRARLAANP